MDYEYRIKLTINDLKDKITLVGCSYLEPEFSKRCEFERAWDPH